MRVNLSALIPVFCLVLRLVVRNASFFMQTKILTANLFYSN